MPLMVTEDGRRWDVPEENMAAAQAKGARLLTEQELAEGRVNAKLGEVGGTAAAVGLGALGGATFGIGTQILQGILAGAQGKSQAAVAEELSDIAAASPIASGVGEVAGTIGSSLLMPGGGIAGGVERAVMRGAGGGAAKAAGAATTALTLPSAGAAVLEDVAKNAPRLARKIAAQAAGGAAEGAAYSIGNLIHEEALGDADFTAEALLAAGGTGALFGGAATAAASAGMAGARRVVKAVAPDDVAETLREMANVMTGHAFGIRGSDYQKLAGKGAKGNKAALELLERGRDYTDPLTNEKLVLAGDDMGKTAEKTGRAREFVGNEISNIADAADAEIFSQVDAKALFKNPDIPKYFFLKNKPINDGWLREFSDELATLRRDPRYINRKGNVSEFARDVESVANSLEGVADWYKLPLYLEKKTDLEQRIAGKGGADQAPDLVDELTFVNEAIARIKNMNFDGGFRAVWDYRRNLDDTIFGKDPNKLSAFSFTEKNLLKEKLRTIVQGHLKEGAKKISPELGENFVKRSAEFHDIARLDNLVQMRSAMEQGLSPVSLRGGIMAAAGMAGGIAMGSPLAPLMAIAGAAGTGFIKDYGAAASARLFEKASKFAAAKKAQGWTLERIGKGVDRFLSGTGKSARAAGSWSLNPTMDPEEVRAKMADPEGLVRRAQMAFDPVGVETPNVLAMGYPKAMAIQQAAAAAAPQAQGIALLPGIKKPLPPTVAKEWSDIYTTLAHPINVILDDLPNHTVTPKKAETLAQYFPSIHQKASQYLLMSLSKRKTPLSPDEKAQLEMFLGIPLEEASTPEYQAWLAGFERARAGKAQERVEAANIRRSAVDASKVASNNQTRGQSPRGGKEA